MIRCAITDRTLFPGDEHRRQTSLIRQALRWARRGIDLIQLREKDLSPSDLGYLATSVLVALAAEDSPTRLLLNGPVEVAVKTRAHGVHLSTTAPATPEDVRNAYAAAGLPPPIVTLSCHTIHEVEHARLHSPDAILFAPVFGKVVAGRLVSPAVGLEALRAACEAASSVPVYALGGVTLANAPQCLSAGAQGIAGIRLFLDPPSTSSPSYSPLS
ncbi:MAG TPA: thiamine phosphate synthase [Edaphobacter sp.]